MDEISHIHPDLTAFSDFQIPFLGFEIEICSFMLIFVLKWLFLNLELVKHPNLYIFIKLGLRIFSFNHRFGIVYKNFQSNLI